MSKAALLTPNEVAALADTSKTIVEKALEQKALSSPHGVRANRRLLPLHAVALAVAVKSLGRRLTVNDKKRIARELARLSPAALKTAKIEVAPSVSSAIACAKATRDRGPAIGLDHADGSLQAACIEEAAKG